LPSSCRSPTASYFPMMMVRHLSGNCISIPTLCIVFPCLSVFINRVVQYFHMYFTPTALLLLSFVYVFVPLLQFRLLFLFRTCDFPVVHYFSPSFAFFHELHGTESSRNTL
jgi:hypothetical protein